MLVVLLGNPGQNYRTTRHNAAWIAAQSIIDDADWQLDTYHQSELAETVIVGQRVIWARPTTFMNLSGNAIRLLMKKYNLTPDQVVVIHDDIDYPLGELKIAVGRGAAHHNGVISSMAILGAQMIRIRIGIGVSDRNSSVADFVLQKFRPEELDTITACGGTLRQIITDIVVSGVTGAMNVWNRKK